MQTPHVAWLMLLPGLMLFGVDAIYSQDYPNRLIRIVTSGAGGNSDFSARLIAQGISGALGRQVIVDNRGSGVVPGEIVSKAPPDGYTLLCYGTPLWLRPLMQTNVPYDAVRDFSPISMATRSPTMLVVPPSLPVKSVKELIALAKRRPGALNYASSGIGSSSHLAAELFKLMAGLDIVGVNYKATGLAIADVISGQVQLTFAGPSSVWPLVKSGRLRSLAVSSAEQTALAPGVPTVAASGLAGYEFFGMTGIFAPAKTSVAIVDRLNQEIARFLHTSEAKEQYLSAGVEAVGSSPQQFANAIRDDIARMSKVIRDASIHAE